MLTNSYELVAYFCPIIRSWLYCTISDDPNKNVLDYLKVRFDRLDLRLTAWCTDHLIGAGRPVGIGGAPPCLTLDACLAVQAKPGSPPPHPAAAAQGHNWPAYEAGLRQRGSLTVWFSEEAVAAWAAAPRTTRGGQPSYSLLAILTALTLRAVFRLAHRQAEGLIGCHVRFQ
jgi:hypothetical protein